MNSKPFDLVATPALVGSYLAGYAVHGIEASPDSVVAKVSFLIHPQECEECGAPLRGHGSKMRAYVDAPLYGRKLTLEIDRARYRCTNGHLPQQPLPDMVEGKALTVRAQRYIEHQSVRVPYLVISERVGLATKTIREVVADYYLRLGKARIPAFVERLEVVPTNFGGTESVLLIDRGRGSLIDLVEQAEWGNYLNSDGLAAAVQVGGIQSVYDPKGLIPDRAERGWELEALPTAPAILKAVHAAQAGSTKTSFATSQARVRLWGDIETFVRGTTEPFEVICDGCSAACIKGETQHIRTRHVVDGTTSWRAQTLCIACLDYRVPVWFEDVRNMTKGE